MSKYIFTDEMAEITGFGSTYEETVRRMIVKGLEWLDRNPTKDPKFKENKNVFGIVFEDNEDAKELSKVLTENEPDITGAMHHASVQHILWIKQNGWEKYVQVKTEQKKEEAGEEDVANGVLVAMLEQLVEDAKDFHFHDFKSQVETPKIYLVQRLQAIIDNVKEGKFDN